MRTKYTYAATVTILAGLLVTVFLTATAASARLANAQRVPAEVIATDVCTMLECVGQQSTAIVTYQADGLRQEVAVPLPFGSGLERGDQVAIMFDPAVGDASLAGAGRVASLAAGGPALTALAAIAATIVAMTFTSAPTWGQNRHRTGHYSYV